MDKRNRYGERSRDERYDEGYRAEATAPPIEGDDDWWLPDEADVTGPDAPFRYRPGEEPSDR
jgi:hypothetical protein